MTINNVNIHVQNNPGVISVIDTVNIGLPPLALPADQAQRLQAAIDAVDADDATQPEAQALKATVAAAPNPAARTDAVKQWLLKLAPAAAGVAGSLLNPAAGKVAEKLASWVAQKIDGAG